MANPGRGGFRFSLLGIVLIFIGILFLLHNLDIVPWGIWGSLWRFWPALLIVIGLNILWGGRYPWLVLILSAVVLGGAVGAAVLFSDDTSQPASEYFLPAAGIEQAEVDISHGAGELTIDSLPRGSSNFVEATAKPDLRSDFRKEGTTGRLELTVPAEDGGPFLHRDIHLSARFNQDTAMQMRLKTGASSASIDLSDLKVTDLRLDVGATSLSLTLPARAGDAVAVIKAGAASLDITVPRGVAARIEVSSGLSSIDVSSRFPRTGNMYESPDYSTAQDRIDLRLEVGVSSVNIE